jgi:hypothetical protein
MYETTGTCPLVEVVTDLPPAEQFGPGGSSATVTTAGAPAAPLHTYDTTGACPLVEVVTDLPPAEQFGPGGSSATVTTAGAPAAPLQTYAEAVLPLPYWMSIRFPPAGQ